MSGTGAKAGNTITIIDEDNNEVATATVQDDGTWSTDISNLSGTSVNDNEFFKASETDSIGDEIAQTDTTHYFHTNSSNILTEDSDDFVVTGSSNDTITTDSADSRYDTVSGDDTNDKTVIDGGDGTDTVKVSKDMSDYTITTDAAGNTILIESSDSDSDGDGTGDITELRNVENITFADGTYDVSSGVFTSNNQGPIANDDSNIETILLGSKEEAGSISDWGNVNNDGSIEVSISGVTGTISATTGSGSSNVSFDNLNSDFGLGVSDGPSNEVDLGETITMEFDNSLSNATIGLDSLYHRYDEHNGEDASVEWVAYENGEIVASGSVVSDISNSDGDSDIATNSISINVPFDKIEFSSEAESGKNANFTIRYIEADTVVTNITDEDSSIAIDVLTNDTDADGDKLAITEIQGQDVSDGQTVNVTNGDNTVLGTATIVEGKVVFTPGENLQAMDNGENQNISFEYTVSDGNGGTDTGNVTVNVTGSDEIVIDTTAPDAPVITTIVDTTDDSNAATVIISGTAEAGSTLELFDGDTSLGSVEVASNGTWSVSPSEFSDGTHSITAQATDAAGNTSEASSVSSVGIGSDGSNRLRIGDDGVDYIAGQGGNDKIYTSAGADVLDGGEGTDNITYYNSSEGVNVNLATNEVSGGNAEGDTISNFENVAGSTKDDTLTGSDGNNVIYAGSGNDTIDGGAGNDQISGAQGDDRISGGEGTDKVVLNGEPEDYSFTQNDDGTVTVEDLREGSENKDGTDTLDGVENVRFDFVDESGINHYDTISLSDMVNRDADEEASAPTLDINISDATVTTTSSDNSITPDTPKTALTPDLTDATNEGDAGSGYNKLTESDNGDTIIAGDNWDAIDLKGGDDNAQIGDADSGYTKINAGSGDNTIVAGNDWDEVKSGEGNDNITVGSGTVKIQTGAGNDTIDADEAGSGYAKLDAGNGNDNITVGDNWDEVKAGSGDDTVQVGDGSVKVDLGTGTDDATIGDAGSGSSEIKASGSGDNTIVAGDNWDKVQTSSGDDKIEVGDGSLTLNTGSGNDTLVAGDAGSGYASVNTGSGNDNVVIGDNFEKVELGVGNDSLNVGKADSGYTTINAGSGDDTIVADSGWDKIDGGSGDDTVTFKGDASDWTVGERWGHTIVTNNDTGEITQVDNVEHIAFGGTDAQTGTTTSTYSYDITLNSGLTDTDGSESLSSITIDNLPSGVSINGLTANTDGSYTVEVDDNGDAIVTLSSESELSNTELNDIEASVTSTESNGGDTSTTTAYDDLDESTTIDMSNDNNEVATGGDGDDTINMGNAKDQEANGGDGDDTINMGNAKDQEANGGDGDDTINIDGKDFEAYGEAGNDTFKLDSNDFKSISNSGGSGSIKGADFDGNNATIDGGEGLDTLAIEDNMDIDFSTIDDNISNIEVIDLGDGAQNITSLSIEDVLTMTDTDNVLRIDGDSSDSINLNSTGDDAEWTLGDFKTDSETGATYQEATGGEGDNTVTIEISTDITIDQA